LPQEAKVNIKVYNIVGKEITQLVNETRFSGEYEVTWDASNFASGIYFYTLTSGSFIATKKLILLK
jgi:hypothetical protein